MLNSGSTYRLRPLPVLLADTQVLKLRDSLRPQDDGEPADRLPVSHDQIRANLAVRGRSVSSFLLTIATAASTRDGWAVLLA